MNNDPTQSGSASTEATFEEAYRGLEETVQRLEAGNLTLEEAIALYEQGMRLAQQCGAALDAAQLRIQELSLADSQQQPGTFFESEPE